MGVTSQELREGFLHYFKGKGHTIVPSSSLIPQADPTLLFTNAGMNQFKGVFLGDESRSYQRAVSAQKCMRAGGKHNDLENVGYTRRHHTLFEMLGNFSFGDYFKEEAIELGWEYLTKTVGLPQERLWATVFRDDDEAAKIWEKKIGLSPSRIVRLGEKDNFWQMGDVGPCGPCSEILIDQGEALGCGESTCAVGCECDRYLEIWNLVFMQFDRDSEGTLKPLPKPSIDTGMGLERLTAVSQSVTSNYETDLFMPLLLAVGEQAGKVYGKDQGSDRSLRVIADHLRAVTFLITDGILPSNEGRGYVLRRILRRAARHGRLLGLQQPFLHQLTQEVVSLMEGAYPELTLAAASVNKVTLAEEERFISTLDQGLPILNDMVDKVKQAGEKVLPGAEAFKLYDTYGFPLDLITEACREQSITMDEVGFQQELAQQRDRARKAATFEASSISPVMTKLLSQVAPTQFVGYDQSESDGTVQAILLKHELVEEAKEGDEVEILLDVTPFYPEGGGQVGDQGFLHGPSGRMQVRETTKPVPELFLHQGSVQTGSIRVGDRVKALIDVQARTSSARNHTATHLVHAALREILGPHVKQYGSLVAPNRLRFDYAHFQPLSPRDIDDIERAVNEEIRKNDPVQTDQMDIQDAVASGALAFFGDKYGEKVRVVSIDTFSRELCGGTHCRMTGDIGLFKIVSETGVAAGVRRLEAQTGSGAGEYLKKQDLEMQEMSELLKSNRGDLLPKVRKLLQQLKEKDQELEQLKTRLATGQAGNQEEATQTIAGITVHCQLIDGMDMKDLRNVADSLRERVSSGIVVLGSSKDGKASLLVRSTPDIAARFPAHELIKPLAAEVGGTGGGRPEMAQAGGKNPEGLTAALKKVPQVIEDKAQG